jgi:hypothetical protein
MKYWHILLFAAGVLTGYFLFGKTEYIPGDPYPVEIEVPVPVPVQVDRPVYVNTETLVTKYDTIILTQIDTIEILDNFFTSKHYADTLLDSDDAFIFLEETVYQNEIIERNLTFQNRRSYSSPNFWALGCDITTSNFQMGGILRRGENVFRLSAGGISWREQTKPYVGIGYYRIMR